MDVTEAFSVSAHADAIRRAETLRADPAFRRTLAASSVSTPIFSRAFLRDSFWRPFDAAASAIARHLDDPHARKVAITAFRGRGKSTIANKGFPMRRLLWRKSKFWMPILADYGQAVLRAEAVKQELEENRQILQVFGHQKSDLWSKDMWRLANGGFVLPRGGGQSIRGSLAFDVRPDLIVGDDAQKDEEVGNAEQREKFSDWWFGPVCGAVDRGNPDWKIVYIANVTHQDALIVHLLNDPEWVHARMPLCTRPPRDGEPFDPAVHLVSHYPDYMSDAAVRSLYDELRRNGKEHVFARDYLCEPGAPGRGAFPPEFNYWTPEMMADSLPRLERCLLLDPARTANPSSDYSAVVCWGLDTKAGRLMLLDAAQGRWPRDRLFQEYADAAVRNRCVNLFCEATGESDFFLVSLNDYLARRNLPAAIPLRPHGKPKTSADGTGYSRIGELANYYRIGVVWHHPDPKISRELEGQLRDYPHARHDDLSDAAAYVIEAMALGDRRFEPVRLDGDGQEPLPDATDLWRGEIDEFGGGGGSSSAASSDPARRPLEGWAYI